jgi:hypothetical protein
MPGPGHELEGSWRGEEVPGFGFAHSAGVAACLGNLAYAFFQAFLPVFLLFFLSHFG